MNHLGLFAGLMSLSLAIDPTVSRHRHYTSAYGLPKKDDAKRRNRQKITKASRKRNRSRGR